DDACFGRGVRDGRTGMRPARRSRRHGDDATFAARLHAWQEALDRQERRAEIAVDRGAPAVLADFLQGRWPCEAAAAISNQHVDPPEPLVYLAAHRPDLGEFRHVAGHSNRGAARTFDLGAPPGERRSITAVDNDAGARLGERTRDAGADAA